MCAAPAQGGELVAAEAHDGHVALPAAGPAGVLVADVGEPHALDHEVGDLGHSDVVPGAGVEDLEALPAPVGEGEHRGDDVADVDVGLALAPVAEDAQLAWGPRAAGARSRR